MAKNEQNAGLQVAEREPATGGVEITMPNGKKETFRSQAEAEQAYGNAANLAAAQNVGRAMIGGREYRSFAQGLTLCRTVLNLKIEEDRLKPKELTTAKIFEIGSEIDIEEAVAILRKGLSLLTDVKQLAGKHQAPMAGGILPRVVAMAATEFLRPQSGAAAKEGAKATVFAAMGQAQPVKSQAGE